MEDKIAESNSLTQKPKSFKIIRRDGGGGFTSDRLSSDISRLKSNRSTIPFRPK